MRRTAAAICLFVFAILSAARDVSAKSIFTSGISPFFLTFLSFSVTLIFFYPISSAHRRRVSRPAGFSRRYVLMLLGLNFLTFGAFLSSFLAIGIVDEFTANIIDYGGSPIATMALAMIIRRERPDSLNVAGMCISAVGILLLTMAMTNSQTQSTSTILGMLLALGSALALAGNNIINKSLLERGFARSVIISLRMIVPTFLMFTICAIGSSFDGLTINDLLIALVWAFVGVTLPLYLLAFALERLQVKDVAIYLFMIPLLTYIGALAMGHHEFTLIGAIGSGVIALGVCVGEYFPRGSRRPKV